MPEALRLHSMDGIHGPGGQTVRDQIHCGDRRWNDLIKEVNQWVDEQRAAYDQEKLAEEVKQIGKGISVEEFQRFYKTKRESTESSPSGRHVGHYKVAVGGTRLRRRRQTDGQYRAEGKYGPRVCATPRPPTWPDAALRFSFFFHRFPQNTRY